MAWGDWGNWFGAKAPTLADMQQQRALSQSVNRQSFGLSVPITTRVNNNDAISGTISYSTGWVDMSQLTLSTNTVITDNVVWNNNLVLSNNTIEFSGNHTDWIQWGWGVVTAEFEPNLSPGLREAGTKWSMT